MARQYFLELPQAQPQRTNFIARRQSYHGNTLGSLSLGNHPARKAPYSAMLSTNVSYVSPCYAYRNQRVGESDEDYVGRLAQELESEFQAVGCDTVCAFVAETVSGSVGISSLLFLSLAHTLQTLGSVPPVPGYFKAVREVCDRHGALLILDEVMSGMGRTGTLHAWEQDDVIPDLQTIAKGLGAGYMPIGALLIGEKIVHTLGNGSGAFIHSQTYQGHPVACAAALQVYEIIQSDNLLTNVRTMGAYLQTLLESHLGGHKHVGNIRGRGLFWGVSSGLLSLYH
jgi:adenosylmethionine-8-amino-7-oxononanoate aminotransferase